jgi:hydrogenase expression/formation protein HypE
MDERDHTDHEQPVPEVPSDREPVTAAHGAGGPRTRQLVADLVLSRFEGAEGDVGLAALDDGAVLPVGDGERSLVVTADSHVVTPPEFPGGDIGRLAVAGTVNDLAVMGGTDPLALSCSLVVEEGVDRALLDRVMDSVAATCETAGCPVVTGDTKVMGRGEVDTLVVNTTGVAVIQRGEHVPDAGLRPGDAIVVSGTVGDHGIALLAEREGFDFNGDLASDVAPVNELVATATAAGEVTAMTDPTRGGFATALNEMVDKAGVGAVVDRRSLPVADDVAAAGEVLGIDPTDVASEGKVVFGVDAGDAEAVVDALRSHRLGTEAAVVGEATEAHPGRVVLDTGLGRRYLSEPEGEQFPRIC